VYPRRHFKHSTDEVLQKTIAWFCRKCHDELEELIPFELQPLTFYPAIVQVFLEAA